MVNEKHSFRNSLTNTKALGPYSKFKINIEKKLKQKHSHHTVNK